MILMFGHFYLINAQNEDNETISKIYISALNSTSSFQNLKILCDSAPGRMVGSLNAENAVRILMNQLDRTSVDTLYKQEYYATSWICKSPGQAVAIYKDRYDTLNVATLGMSISTPEKGIKGKLLEVFSLDELDSLGSEIVKDKIVFFNRAMDNSEINTFSAYRGAIDQRVYGAIKAAEHGAKGVIVRSLATESDDFPHTGVSRYKDDIKKIPVLSISTDDAEKLSEINSKYPDPTIWLNCQTVIQDSVKTSNLIAELRGRKKPENVILIGAHIDSWYNTAGAHDDGAGCVQMIDVLRIFNELNIKPNNTIRLVLFMDEELNQSGAEKYAKYAGQESKKHIMAIESDAGGFLPIGFGIDAGDSIADILKKQISILDEYGIHTIIKGFAGVDIKELAKYNVPLVGLLTNSQRYFEVHHSENDTFDKVGRRELQLGTASVASLVYLIDKYGIQ